jgi:dCTP diphosphatase
MPKSGSDIKRVAKPRRKSIAKVGKNELPGVQRKILDFRNARDWAQFHDPKNLAEALSIEAGELLENFLWKTTEQSRNLSAEKLKNVKEELADIFIFLTYLCEECKIDLLKEVESKVAHNELKYPVEKAKGSSKKYTEF